jgi:hypothetical protein
MDMDDFIKRIQNFDLIKSLYSFNLFEIDDIANNYDLLSGITSHIDKHKQAVDINKRQIRLKTISFADLLKEYDAPSFIDYLSLDTEGSELEILKSVDFSKYTFGVIDVEHNFVEPRRTEMRKLLTAHDYVYVGQNQWDDSYVHKSVYVRAN